MLVCRSIAAALLCLLIARVAMAFPPPLRELSGHTNSVYQAVYSPSGRFIATASFDQTVRLWDAEKLTPMTSFEGHNGIVLTAIFSPDERLVASGALDNTIRLWEVPLPDPVGETLSMPGGLAAMSVSFDGSLLVAAGRDGKIVLFDLVKKQARFEISWQGAPITSLAIRRDNQLFTVVTAAGTVHTHSCEQGEQKGIVGAHHGAIVSAEFTANNTYLLTVGKDGFLRRFPATPVAGLTFEPAPAEIVTAVLDATGARLATAGSDHAVVLWDANQGKPIRKIEGHTQTVRALAFSPNGATLATAGDEQAVRLFQTGDGKMTQEFKNLPAKITLLRFRPDGQRLAIGFENGTLGVMQATDGSVVHTLTGHTGSLLGIEWGTDGKTIVSAGTDGSVRSWDAEQGKEISQVNPEGKVTAFAVNPKGDQFAVTPADKSIRVYPLGKTEPLITLPPQSEEVVQLAFSKDGEQLLSADSSGAATLWNLKTALPQQRFTETGGPLTLAGFRADRAILTVGRGKTIFAQVPSVQVVVRLEEPEPTVAAVAANGNEITVGTKSGKLLTYNVNNGDVIPAFGSVQGEVHAVGYSPNSALFAVTGADKSVQLWRVNNRQRERDLNVPSNVTRIDFSPDSRKLLVTGDDRVLRSYATFGSGRAVSRTGTPTLSTPIQELSPLGETIVGVGVAADNSNLYVASAEGKILNFRLSSSESTGSLTGHSGQIYGLAFHPTGESLVSVSSDKTLRLWNPHERKVIRTIGTLENILYGVSFLPDGKSVVVAGANRIMRRIDVESGRVLQNYEGCEETLYSAAVSHDGKFVAASGTGLGPSRSIWVWPVDQSQPRLTLQLETDSVYKVAFNRAGTRLLAVGYNGKSAVFDLSSGELIHPLNLPAVLYSGTFSPDDRRVLFSTGSHTAIEVELPEGVR